MHNLTFMWPWIVITSCNKTQLDALVSQIYFYNELHMFRRVPLSIIRSFSLHIQQTCMYYCVCNEKLLKMDRGTVRNDVEFHSKNKFEKLVHLVGFYYKNQNSINFVWTTKSHNTDYRLSIPQNSEVSFSLQFSENYKWNGDIQKHHRSQK